VEGPLHVGAEAAWAAAAGGGAAADPGGVAGAAGAAAAAFASASAGCGAPGETPPVTIVGKAFAAPRL
jgi:hypothetical protein